MTDENVLLNVDANWRVRLVDAQPRIERGDGKFFAVEINSDLGFSQPIIRENVDASGFCGTVVPIVREFDGTWKVAVVSNKRIGAHGTEMLIEASRRSIDNASPSLTSGQYRVQELGGPGRSNSARIIGKIRCGVVDVSDVAFELPANASWMTFADFAAQSSDMMAQAVLFRFLCLK